MFFLMKNYRKHSFEHPLIIALQTVGSLSVAT